MNTLITDNGLASNTEIVKEILQGYQVTTWGASPPHRMRDLVGQPWTNLLEQCQTIASISGAEEDEWELIMQCIVCIHNRTPTQCTHKKTPYEIRTGSKPECDEALTIPYRKCVCYGGGVTNMGSLLTMGVGAFVGFEEQSDGRTVYKVMDEGTSEIVCASTA